MNVFLNDDIAINYDNYYKTPSGIKIDYIEKDVIAEFLKDKPAQVILELGCGTGHWTEFLTHKGYEVIGIDISDAMLDIARRKNLLGCKFMKADASELPFENNSFDTVVSITMLEFTGNIPKVLNEIHRVLKPQGNLILGCLNANSTLGKSKEHDDVFRNAHFFSKDELKAELSVLGPVEFIECVYLNSAFDILDGSMENYPVEGVFLGASVKKAN